MLYKVRNIISHTVAYYLKFFYIIIGYSLILLALLAMLNTNSFDIYSGDLFYTLMNSEPNLFVAIIVLLFATAVQSFFSTILIFSIRRELQQGYNRRTNVVDALKEFVWQMFTFNLLLNVVLFVLYIIFTLFGIGFLLPVVYIVILVLTFFTNQSIIIDEFGPLAGIELSSEFVFTHKTLSFFTIFCVFILFLITGLLTFYIPGGYIIGIILVHLFLYPILEILRTIVYMTKFKILDSYL